MRKIFFIFAAFCITGCVLSAPPESHADYYSYPCSYPAQGDGGDVQLLIHAGGQYCDWPMEVNGSHYHCMSGGGGIGGGAIGLVPIGGLTVGGFGNSGVGLNLESCRFVCPDGTQAPWPNPPGGWSKHLVLQDKYNDCRDHMEPQGETSTPQQPDSGPPDAAGKPVDAAATP